MKQLLQFIKKNRKPENYLLIVVFLALLFLPRIVNGPDYLVGGDDMRLYYIFPDKYLENYVFNIISDNTLAGASTGYASVAYYAPIFYFIKFLKVIPLNTQYLLYGLNLAFGFLFFYKTTGLFLKGSTHTRAIASLAYVFSPFLISTLHTHQMLSIYLISVMPASLYYFATSIIDKRIHKALISVLIFSVFSTTLNTLPWSSAFVVGVTPILLMLFIENKKQFLISAIVFAVSFFALNFYWIFHFLNSYLNNTGLSNTLQYYSSTEFVGDNLRIVRGVSTLFSPLNIIFYNMSYNFVKEANLIHALNATPFLFVILGFRKYKYGLIYSAFAAFAVSWFLFSPNIFSFGPDLFLSLSTKIPFFTMYRNMYDKFALPLAFTFSICIYIGLVQVSKIKFKFTKYLLISILVLVVFISSKSYFFPKVDSENNMRYFSGEFNSDYVSLISYLENMDNASRVLWLPLNGPTYSVIENKNKPGQYYFGLSPMRILADRSDYAGRFSFLTQGDLYLGDELFELIRDKKYDEVGKIFQRMNARYIVTDNQSPPELFESFLYGGDEKPILASQDDEFKKAVLGDKIKDFGSRYSLYTIAEEYMSDKIFITGAGSVNYKKISSSEYLINIKGLGNDSNLVFLDPYYKDWTITNLENKSVISENQNRVYKEYANEWSIPLEGDVNLRLEFKPAMYSKYANSISIAALIVASLYLLKKLSFFKSKNVR